MIDTILEKIKALVTSRLLPITLIYLMLFGVLVYRLFALQIVKGEVYREQATANSTKEVDVPATRGNIYDSNGVLLAYNDITYSVTLMDTDSISSNETLNAMLNKIIHIIESNGDSINIDFGLAIDKNDNVTFTKEGNALKSFKRDVYALSNIKSLSEKQLNSTAEEVFDYLRYDTSSNSLGFNISSEYTKQEAYKIMAIRFEKYLNGYNNAVALDIADNVSEATVTAIKEYSGDLPGLDIEMRTTRKYTDKYAYSMAQILGYTGSISDELWSTMNTEEDGRSKIYARSDQFGKTGIEADFEKYLHGNKGTNTVTLNSDNQIENSTTTKQAEGGSDVYLTIDADLQNACYTLIEKELAGILLTKIHPNDNETVKKGNSTEQVIPIKNVYYSFIDNEILNINKFSESTATSTEKNVYNKLVSRRDSVFKKLRSILSYSSPDKTKSQTDEYQEYLNYFYDFLVDNNILLTESIDKEDETYKAYTAGTITISEFLQYALGNDLIDRKIFSDPQGYYDSREIYEALMDYMVEQLTLNKDFNKLLYKYMIADKKITGEEICLLLFDQDVLKYDEKAINNLKRGSTSAYTFIREKITKLEITPGQLALNPCSGSIVVTDTNTGAVKAMVSYPGYDNNKLANRIDSTYYSKLLASDAFPLINRPIQQLTAPGSTYKMLVSIVGLQENEITVEKKIHDDLVFDEINPSPRCWIGSGSHGDVNVSEALMVSCNYFFYQLGWDLGWKNSAYHDELTLSKLGKYAKMFGFGKPTGIELQSEYTSKVSDEQGVRSAIGQGTNNFTPASLSKYVTGLSNRGTVYDLSIVNKVVDINGKAVLENKPKVYQEINNVNESYWNAVLNGMNMAVNGDKSSIKKLFKDFDFKVAGKTGTAQENKKLPDHALFVSYAPYENPEISVTSVIPHGYTSGNAAELARDVYKYYFDVEGRKALLKEKVQAPELNTALHD